MPAMPCNSAESLPFSAYRISKWFAGLGPSICKGSTAWGDNEVVTTSVEPFILQRESHNLSFFNFWNSAKYCYFFFKRSTATPIRVGMETEDSLCFKWRGGGRVQKSYNLGNFSNFRSLNEIASGNKWQPSCDKEKMKHLHHVDYHMQRIEY